MSKSEILAALHELQTSLDFHFQATNKLLTSMETYSVKLQQPTPQPPSPPLSPPVPTPLHSILPPPSPPPATPIYSRSAAVPPPLVEPQIWIGSEFRRPLKPQAIFPTLPPLRPKPPASPATPTPLAQPITFSLPAATAPPLFIQHSSPFDIKATRTISVNSIPSPQQPPPPKLHPPLPPPTPAPPILPPSTEPPPDSQTRLPSGQFPPDPPYLPPLCTPFGVCSIPSSGSLSEFPLLHDRVSPQTAHIQPLLQEKFSPDLPLSLTNLSHLFGSMTMVPSPFSPPTDATPNPSPNYANISHFPKIPLARSLPSPPPIPPPPSSPLPNPPSAPLVLRGFKPSSPMVEFEFHRADEARFEDVAIVGVVSNFYTFPISIDVLVIAGYHVQLCGEPPPETPLVSFLRLNLTSQVLITGPIEVYIWPKFQEEKSNSSYSLKPNPMGNEGPSPLPQAVYTDPTEFQPATSIKCYHLEDKVVVEEGGNDTPQKPNTSGSSIIE